MLFRHECGHRGWLGLIHDNACPGIPFIGTARLPAGTAAKECLALYARLQARAVGARELSNYAGERRGMILRAFLAWIGIACAETLHGILRVRLLNPRIGDRSARRISVFSGSAIILALGWISIPWIAPESPTDSMKVGALWLVLMLTYDIGLARMVFRMPCRRIVSDFDLRKGNMLGVGMIILLVTPVLMGRWRGLY